MPGEGIANASKSRNIKYEEEYRFHLNLCLASHHGHLCVSINYLIKVENIYIPDDV